jgi:hypothetical protein
MTGDGTPGHRLDRVFAPHRLYTRNNRDVTATYPELAELHGWCLGLTVGSTPTAASLFTTSRVG